jgi:probable rRNA maturation factor
LTEVEISGSVPRLPHRELAEFVRKTLLALGRMNVLPEEISDVSIALVDDAAMQILNRRFRGKNKTTDVLTFPADDSYAEPASDARPLGDIVISVDQARRQAATEGHAIATEIRYLVVHGILHALGYDHETDQGEMNALELRVRQAVGLT